MFHVLEPPRILLSSIPPYSKRAKQDTFINNDQKNVTNNLNYNSNMNAHNSNESVNDKNTNDNNHDDNNVGDVMTSNYDVDNFNEKCIGMDDNGSYYEKLNDCNSHNQTGDNFDLDDISEFSMY